MNTIKIFNVEFDAFENNEDVYKVNDTADGFFLLVELELGLEGGNGSELFRFNICDLKGLNNRMKNEVSLLKDHCLMLNDYNIIIMKRYSYDSLLKKLNEIFEKAVENSENWNVIAKKLKKYFYWEYENEIN